jgi:hypothetical protein
VHAAAAIHSTRASGQEYKAIGRIGRHAAQNGWTTNSHSLSLIKLPEMQDILINPPNQIPIAPIRAPARFCDIRQASSWAW